MTATPVAATNKKPDTVLARPSAAPVLTKEISEMLIYEELARARIQELRDGGRPQRIHGNARAARRWNRMARWAAQRARRYGA